MESHPAGMDIVRRAYELWQQAGEPKGRDQEFYHKAEQELRDADESSRTLDDPLRSTEVAKLINGELRPLKQGQ
jgi:Protein of unknown function (DUF2934)